MTEQILQVLLGIVSIVISIGGGFVINYIKNKVGNEKLQQYYFLIKTVVMSIEQVYGDLDGEDKKALAIAKIKELVNGALTDDEIDRLIEAAVYEVKKLLQGNQ